MGKRSQKKIFIFVIIFYILVALLAVCILNLSGSIFAKRGEVNLKGHFRSIWGAPDDDAVEIAEDTDPMDKLQGLEALEEATEIATEPATELPLPPQESEPVTEEPVSEPPSEEPEPAEPEVHYYSFKTNNTDTRLRMRKDPGEDGKIIYELKPGSTGYVIELGDDWSKVAAYGHEGYCANEFLTMTEVTEEEYEELKESHKKAEKKRSDTAQSADAANLAAEQVAAALLAAAEAAPAAEAQTGETAPAEGGGNAAPAEDQ